LDRAAHAILTTDTRIKVYTGAELVAGVPVRLTGFAKGAAMIGPNLATMLAFILTDASIAPDDLADIARTAGGAFNSISVEGHTSTNDSLLLFANGTGPRLKGEGLARFTGITIAIATILANMIVADAEGGAHVIHIAVEGLRSLEEADRVARTVANSALVKTAIFGADPNWGRIVSAAGYAGVDFEEKNLSLWLGEYLLYEAGVPQPFDAVAASAYLKNNRDVYMTLRFNLGPFNSVFTTSDLTYEYVRLNAEYTT
jgi:glutamate N-acetyltransferase/amino-acid N-acetyltransferase